MKTVAKLWENNYEKLGQINPECPLKNWVVKKTMRPWRYKERADMITKELNPQDSILEIGCGFGGLALEILRLISIRYTVVDNKLMLIQAKKYLGKKVEYIEASLIETLRDRKFELFISHFCLSETPAEYREYILKYIIKNCQKIFIIDFHDGIKPTLSMIQNGWDIIPLRLEEWLGKYFIIKKNELRRGRKDQFVYTGERKKEA